MDEKPENPGGIVWSDDQEERMSEEEKEEKRRAVRRMRSRKIIVGTENLMEV